MTGYIGPYEYDIYMNDINWIELILFNAKNIYYMSNFTIINMSNAATV